MNFLDSLHRLRVDASAFESNISMDDDWIGDGHIFFRLRASADQRLAKKLASKGLRPRNFDWSMVLRMHVLLARFPVHAAAHLAESAPMAHQGLVRFTGPLPGPAFDVSADYLRLMMAVLGPWDLSTGAGYRSAVAFWRAGELIGFLAPREFTFKAWPEGPTLHGKDPPLPTPPPPWKPEKIDIPKPPKGVTPKTYLTEEVGRLARALGGVEDPRRGFSWVVPTRAGVLRLGVDEQATIRHRFDEPARAQKLTNKINVPEAAFDDSDFSSDIAFLGRHSVAAMRDMILRTELPLAPQDRPDPGALRGGFLPSLFAPRYQFERYDTRDILEDDRYAVRDLENGKRLPGATSMREANRAAIDLSVAYATACALSGKEQ